MTPGLSRSRTTRTQKSEKTCFIALTWSEFGEIWRALQAFKHAGKTWAITSEKLWKAMSITKENKYPPMFILPLGFEPETASLSGRGSCTAKKGSGSCGS